MDVRFGYGSPDKIRDVEQAVRLAQQADRDGLDHVTFSDHPYVADLLDGYAEADGWIPGRAADWLSDRYRWSRPIIDEAARAVGRKPEDVATIYNFPGEITSAPVRRTRDDDGRWVGGSSAQWIEELTDAVLNHNAAGFTLFPRGADPFAVQLSRWSDEIVPAVRAAITAQPVAER